MNVSSDWVNRIDYIPHIDWVQMLVCEIPNIAMNFRSTGVWAHQPNLPQSNRKRSFQMKSWTTKVQEILRSKWMVSWSSIQIIPVQYWALFSTQSTTKLNMSSLMRQSGCWMPIRFSNHQKTVSQATSVQFLACPEWCYWRTSFGPYGSLWGGGIGILICQERWWRM